MYRSVRLMAALGVAFLGTLAGNTFAAPRASLGRPDLVIAGRPTSALDADTRLDFLALLKGECADVGTTSLFVSHDTAFRRVAGPVPGSPCY